MTGQVYVYSIPDPLEPGVVHPAPSVGVAAAITHIEYEGGGVRLNPNLVEACGGDEVAAEAVIAIAKVIGVHPVWLMEKPKRLKRALEILRRRLQMKRDD